MQYNFEDYGKYVEITGYKNVNFAQVEAFLKANRKQKQAVDIQFFDADLIATQEHLYFAALNALQAFKGKTNISKSLAMEAMLYASAQRQIQKAIERCGIDSATKNMAVLLIGDTPKQIESMLEEVKLCVNKEPDETVMDMTPAKEEKICKAFEITEQELETVTKNGDKSGAKLALVIERMALLSTQI